ncbi:MAG: peptidoglycan bridge formation glycyltransferase FemA/FemB family protein [Anaerolineales bacterium]
MMSLWNDRLASFPEPHFLQTRQWAQVKGRFGWQADYLWWTEDDFFSAAAPPADMPAAPVAMALLLRRRLPIGGFAARLNLCYAPKGPILRSWEDAGLRARVLADMEHLARRRRAVFLKIDPDVPLGQGLPGEAESTENPAGLSWQADLTRRGWHYSDEQIQFRNTVLVDLRAFEDDLLARMKQKTRYNIRLAARKGVSVRIATQDDWGMLYRMYAETARRDGFIIRDEAYYRTVWQVFSPAAGEAGHDAPVCEPLIAEVEGQTVAAVVIMRFARRAYYFYGMSLPDHREKMPAYLLQWEAMRRARAAGCTCYDLWGAPEVFDESDSLWGVYRFKRGLGGAVRRTLGAWDYPASARWARVYTWVRRVLR